MDLISSLPPAFILIIGALLVPLFKGQLRNWFVIALPILAFFHILNLDSSTQYIVNFLGFDLNLIRADRWAKVFGYVFTLSAFATCIYGFYLKKSLEFTSALLYIGSALGVVFAGDLISLYIFWESMALTSVILILARRTDASTQAAFRYVIVHIFGGLVLLAGIVLHIYNTGSISFTQFTTETLSTWLILIGFLVNAAAYPLSSWLPDAYPEASVFGGVILSAYTSKTAVYTLIRGFPGWEILIIIGCVMAIYGVIYGLLENDIRRILSYSIVNQVGFMLVAVGIGSPLALAGAAAHAFCHIIYKGLLWMSAGAVLYRTGTSKCSELGGLIKHMPYTFAFGLIGGLSIIAPLTSGFTFKPILFYAAEQAHLFWPWLILEITSVGVFINAAVKIAYFVFFGKDSGHKPKEANPSMLIAMAFLSGICIFLGVYPQTLLNVLPNTEIIQSAMSFDFYYLYIKKFSKVIFKVQIMALATLMFFVFLPLLKRKSAMLLDIDWVYRKGWPLFYKFVSTSLTAINNAVYYVVVTKCTMGVIAFAKNAPANAMLAAMIPVWRVMRYSNDDIKKQIQLLRLNVEANSFPVGLASLFILVAVAFFVV